MYYKLKTLSCLTLLLLLSNVLAANAEDSPKEVVDSMLGKVKAEGSILPVLDFVHWEQAFKEFPEANKKLFPVSSAEEMKAYFFDILSDPQTALKKHFKQAYAQRTESVKNPQTGETVNADQIFEKIAMAMAQKIESYQEKIKTSDYEVGEAKVEGDQATVDVKILFPDGKSKHSKLHLIKVNNEWRLSSPSLAGDAMKGLSSK